MAVFNRADTAFLVKLVGSSAGESFYMMKYIWAILLDFCIRSVWCEWVFDMSLGDRHLSQQIDMSALQIVLDLRLRSTLKCRAERDVNWTTLIEFWPLSPESIADDRSSVLGVYAPCQKQTLAPSNPSWPWSKSVLEHRPHAQNSRITVVNRALQRDGNLQRYSHVLL